MSEIKNCAVQLDTITPVVTRSKFTPIDGSCFGLKAKARLAGTKFLSRSEVMALANVSRNTLIRAIRVGRGDRKRWGQARIAGLRATYVNGALAFGRDDVRRWISERKKDRRTARSKKINRDPSKLRPNEQ